MTTEGKHRNDIYGDIAKDRENEATETPATPAATVLLLREKADIEVLMLHKTSKVAFGGLWVFPGGKIDAGDFPADGDVDTAARHAAVRETEEEAGILIPQEDFVWFAHWTPPPSTARRFATWFFLSSTEEDQEITVDGGEIQNHQWVSPRQALDQHARGEIDLAPPTWVSLYQLSRFKTAGDALAHFSEQPPRYYQTRVVQDNAGTRVCLWNGDLGYETWDANLKGETHRLSMKPEGFEFLHSAVDY